MKVHAKRNFPCSRCDKIFSSLTFKAAHELNCGQDFICIQCGWIYKSKEALMTHCRRKNHSYVKPVQNNVRNVEKEYRHHSDKRTKIAPKVVSSKLRDKAVEVAMFASKKSQSTQTQSADNQSDKNFLDDWNKLVKKPSRTKEDKSRADKSKAETTKSGKTTTTNRSFRNLDIFDTESSTLMTNSSYAQTDKNLNNLNYVEDDSLLYFGSENFHAGLCHIETQTEYKLFQENITETTNSDQLDQLLYSNMHTQTCDEILSELGLTNIQTQTNWPATDYTDLLVSTETQTIHSTFLLGNSSSTQTQTNSSEN